MRRASYWLSRNGTRMVEQLQSRPLKPTVKRVDEIVVIGGGGHAKVVISILHKLKRYRILGYTDHKDHGTVLGVPFLGPDQTLSALAKGEKTIAAVLGVGQVGIGNARCELWTRLQSFLSSLSFPFIVSPDAIINEDVSIGEGAVIMDGTVINGGTRIGSGVIVNTNSTIEHDVTLADWVHVAPGATISGGVTVGRFSMIGAGATVIEGIKIADGCMVGAGAVVVDDVTEPGTYVGCPARRIK
jgi:sugar O-acyltransferase (sialic acid O-acetyltransferase NeuD family)